MVKPTRNNSQRVAPIVHVILILYILYTSCLASVQSPVCNIIIHVPLVSLHLSGGCENVCRRMTKLTIVVCCVAQIYVL